MPESYARKADRRNPVAKSIAQGWVRDLGG